MSAAAALKDVRERGDMAALVVRVAGPGGSALASDLMWRELERTRAVKPVVASCGDVAASGGYYVAMVGRPLLVERVPRPKRWQLPRLNLSLPGSVFLRERLSAVLPFRLRFF